MMLGSAGVLPAPVSPIISHNDVKMIKSIICASTSLKKEPARRRRSQAPCICLLVDFGSTYTKIAAADLEREEIIGWAQSPTTVDTDITIGLDKALSNLADTCGIDINKVGAKYACSSAAGGLIMAAIGLVPELTLEAARRAALGAGAKVVCGYGYEIDEEIVKEIETAKCDIILLSGGTDGGDKKTILHNAEMLANSRISCPILVAGNRVAANKAKAVLEKKNKTVYISKNVLPSLDVVDVEPAQNIIRDIFLAHIIKAKGLEKAQEFIGKTIIPTPKATLLAAALLAEGIDSEPGIGSLLVVEIGGATTNIHSVADNFPMTPQTIIKGLPEQKLKRTVEGDLGIRYNAHTIFDLAGEETLRSRLSREDMDIKQYIKKVSDAVEYVPSSDVECAMDIVLAKSAALIAVERHSGTVRQEYSIAGEIAVQYGKNLLDVRNIIGTGGIFKFGQHPERILQAGLFDVQKPWSLKPKAPKAFIDSDYILYAIGLLSQDFPSQALRIAKKHLKQYNIEYDEK
jgi:uncharacterized protein (TIGR01319 family)